MSLIFYLSLFLFVFGYKGADFVKLDTNFFQLSWIIPEQVLRVVYPVFEEAMLLAKRLVEKAYNLDLLILFVKNYFQWGGFWFVIRELTNFNFNNDRF